MIIDKGNISLPEDLTYITNWRDFNGDFEISKYLINGRIIINKKVTGCGLTSWCLWNQYDTILISFINLYILY